MIKVARFLADQTGYLIHPDDWPEDGAKPTGWVRANIGITDEQVLINLDLAYVIETK